MKSISQNYKTGAIKLQDVDLPALKPGGVLVQTAYSVISAGTEGMKVKEAKLGYLGKARARPDQVKNVINSLRQNGVMATYQKVMNKLDSLTPLGYSLSGTVIAVGDGVTDLKVGQRVACAGAGYANHADVNFVPRNLVVPLSSSVDMQEAAFSTIGAIAMHGFRQADLKLGETAIVIGLGLVGQVLVQVLKAAGITVFGVDLDKAKCKTAEKSGAAFANSSQDKLVAALSSHTQTQGADAVFLVAGSSSNALLEQAIHCVRPKGTVVAIGKTKMDLPYSTSFAKEIDFKFSRSYGPGRYDPAYEEGGRDYPYQYVRWTENRNLQAFVDLLDQGALSMDLLINKIYPFGQAADVYEKMSKGNLPGIGILFQYPAVKKPKTKLKLVPVKDTGKGQASLTFGVIGAGNYANSMLLPHLKRDRRVTLDSVVTTTPLTAADAARKFGFNAHMTDLSAMWKRKSIGSVLIATPHASHAKLTIEALKKGRSVFVEKPLAISFDQLKAVDGAVAKSKGGNVMVGLNRRFSPIFKRMKKQMTPGVPYTMTYRVHAGKLEGTSWLADSSVQGSRFVGEATHFIDTFLYLTGATVTSVYAARLSPTQGQGDENTSVTATFQLSDGSMATLVYVTQGSPKTPKEELEVIGGGKTLRMQNFSRLEILGRGKSTRSYDGAKGQKQMLATYLDALQQGQPMPISYQDLHNATWATLAAEESLRTGYLVRATE